LEGVAPLRLGPITFPTYTVLAAVQGGLILRKCDFQQSVAWPGLHPHNTIAPPSQGHWVDLLCTTRLRPWQAGPWQAAAASVALPGLHPDNNIP